MLNMISLIFAPLIEVALITVGLMIICNRGLSKTVEPKFNGGADTDDDVSSTIGDSLLNVLYGTLLSGIGYGLFLNLNPSEKWSGVVWFVILVAQTILAKEPGKIPPTYIMLIGLALSLISLRIESTNWLSSYL